MKAEKGYIHVYTGNGKGKTTASLGLALRTVGAGKAVFFAQFVKGKAYAEVKAIQQHIPGITVRQYGRDCFIHKAPEEADIRLAVQGLQEAATALSSGHYGLVVLDEACIALHYHLFSIEDLLAILDKKHPATEVVITGRYAPPALLEKADLVTEMKNIKHYWDKGVQARPGIEY